MEEKNKKGSITVFLSLCLLVLISFVSTAYQSARIAGSRYLFSQSARAIVTSMCGAYDTSLWQQYRVLALTDTALAETIGDECEQLYEKTAGLFPITIDSRTMTDEVMLTDEGADGWLTSVISYMEYEIPSDLVTLLFEKVDVAGKFSDLADWYHEVENLMEPILKLEEQIRDLEEKYREARELVQESKELAAEAKELIAQIENRNVGQETESAVDTEGSENPQGENGTEEVSLQDMLDSLKNCTEKIQRLAGEKSKFASMLDEVSDVISQVESLDSQLTEVITALKGSGENTFLTTLGELEGYGKQLKQRLDSLLTMPEEIQKIVNTADKMDGLTVPSPGEVISGDGLAELWEWKDFLEEFGVLDVAETSEQPTEGEEEDKKSLTDFRNLREWLSDGYLTLLLPEADNLSDHQIQRVLPREDTESESSILYGGYQNLLYGEYALRYTAQYGEDGGAGLQYETEYLIAGKEGDKENLAETATYLMGVRAGANLVYLLQNTACREQVKTMARSISLAVGGLLPESLVTIFLLILWATGEAFCDVRGLLNGKSVPLWKTEESWFLSWDNLWKLLTPEFRTEIQGADTTEGMDYEDYLRVLLFLVPLQEKCYRTMEVAEENLRETEGTFDMEQAIYRATWNISGTAAGKKCQVSIPGGY